MREGLHCRISRPGYIKTLSDKAVKRYQNQNQRIRKSLMRSWQTATIT